VQKYSSSHRKSRSLKYQPQKFMAVLPSHQKAQLISYVASTADLHFYKGRRFIVTFIICIFPRRWSSFLLCKRTEFTTSTSSYIGLHYDLGFFFQSACKVLLRARQTTEKFRNIKYFEGSSLNPWNRILLEKLTIGQLERVGFYEFSHQWHYCIP
jgi:hypothetical protein